uniref:Putative secreted protein n=1 Tax=Anopheles darlingi TaxID=43151 RepID=A0A2M4D1L6_ANODA
MQMGNRCNDRLFSIKLLLPLLFCASLNAIVRCTNVDGLKSNKNIVPPKAQIHPPDVYIFSRNPQSTTPSFPNKEIND